MATTTRGGLPSFLRTLGPANAHSDAELLGRFAADRDDAAFTVLVQRYAGMVLGVCRRKLGDGPDAEDAFQATFLVLARQAGRIRNGAALPGWLHRVALLTSQKLSVRIARRGAAPLPAEPEDRSCAPDRELREVLDEEIAALSETLRSTFVLCCLDGRTNAEAAAQLNCPVGTIDSRLHAAKQKLRDRLSRRGFAVPLIAAAFTATPTVGHAVSDELIQRTVRAAAAFAAGSALAPSDPLTTLAHEVSATMTAVKFKLIAASALAVIMAGSLGLGIYSANAQAPKPIPQDRKALPAGGMTATGPTTPGAGALKLEANLVPGGNTAATTAALSMPAGFDKPIEMTLLDLLNHLSEKTGATFRADEAFFKVNGIQNVYDQQIVIRITKGLSVKDILDEAMKSIGPISSSGYRVRANQVILGAAFQHPTIPGAMRTGQATAKEVQQIINDYYGPKVSISVKDRSLSEIIDLLREETGANIVLNKAQAGQAGQPEQMLTLTLNDVSLLTVLKVAADICNLAPAIVDNVYYITDKESAEVLMRKFEFDLFGDDPGTIEVPVDDQGRILFDQLNPQLGLANGAPRIVPVLKQVTPKAGAKPAEKSGSDKKQ